MTIRCLPLALGLMIASASPAFAAETVAFWHFGTEETSRLEPHGAVHRDQPGPRPPEFPDFDPGNTAVRLDGRGAHFRFSDSGDISPFKFTNGDTITLEAWVNLPEIKPGENLYIVGKGRTHEKGFPKENQNWALRVREVNGTVRLSFLFFSAPNKDRKGEWHRWTSELGFKPGSGWHHTAVSYKFGDPDSIRGWLDGSPLKGAWDMGGATTRPPVVDNDAIWIGSSQGGNPTNSFRGLLDEIGIHRGALADQTLRGRYRRAANAPKEQEILLPLPHLVSGKVMTVFHEGTEGHDRWPTDARSLAAGVGTWETDLFLFPRLPMRYDAWGIRADWKPTVLLRAAAEVPFPAGRHRLVIRSRGGARLWVDGKVVARTVYHQPGANGHGLVPPDPRPPAPGARTLGYGDHESSAEVETKEGLHTVVLEVLVGGKKFRPETGECCVAVQFAGEKQFRLLGAPKVAPIELTDAPWETAAARQETALTALDDKTRRAAASGQDDHWKRRHAHAQSWAASNRLPAVPEVEKHWPVLNPIDRFLAARMQQALAVNKTNTAGTEFHEKVLPILRENCFRCHGDKQRGSLRLNSRAAALQGGDSGSPALVPGKPEKSELLRRVRAGSEKRMPPKGEGLQPAQVKTLEKWIQEGANWPAPPVRADEVTLSPLTGDAAFLRRVYLDVVGVPPLSSEARVFLTDRTADKRVRLIDRLLADPRWADHWVSYWQDVLAENPNLLKPTLNNSGPFRFFLYESLLDNKPMDRFVTELVMMRGSVMEGGSAGFALATGNDAPMASKAHILSTAFLGVDMGCARCHDAPFHSTKQRDLFNIAAMLERKTLALPATSTVARGFFEKKGRPSLIKVTLKPGEKIEPTWPFAGLTPAKIAPELLQNPADSRERLAVTLTMPENTRFAQALVNRVWKRLLGAGLVEPAHDWEGHPASHPELLQWLAREFVTHGYDFKHVVRLILTSHAYQRQARGNNGKATPERRFFAAPDRRRLTAEQVVDSLFAAAGKPMRVEELTFDADGRQPSERFLNLNRPRRAWQFTSLANERDRPSLSLPRAQAVIDVLEAFGWKGSRQSPLTDRETDPNLLQPGILANGTLTAWISRLSNDSGLTADAVCARSPAELADVIFLRFLSRFPTDEERNRIVQRLAPGFADRLADERLPESRLPQRRPRVSWTNHLNEEATRAMLEYGHRARAGEPPSSRLRPAWRERMEDAVWSVFNLPEFVWLP